MPIDSHGKELSVGDPVIIRGHVLSITDVNTIVVRSDELDYPSTTAFDELTVPSRTVDLN